MRDTFWRLKKRKGSPYYQACRQCQGKKLRVSTSTALRYEAEALIRRWNSELADPAAAAVESVTLEEATTQYLENQTLHGVCEATLEYLTKKIRQLTQALDEKLLLSRVGPATVDRYIASRRMPRLCPSHRSEQRKRKECKHCKAVTSDATIDKELVVLRQILAFSRDRNLYFADPARAVPLLGTAYVPLTAALSEEQADALWLELRQRSPARAAHVAWFLGAMARVAEAARAKRAHLRSGYLYVPGSKTKASKTEIPITNLMRRWLDRAIADAPGRDEAPLFEPWQNMHRDIASACRAAGVPKVTSNDLRRTMLSWHYAAGVPPHLLAELARHASTAMVQKVYVQRTAENRAKALSRYVAVEGQGPAVDKDTSANESRVA